MLSLSHSKHPHIFLVLELEDLISHRFSPGEKRFLGSFSGLSKVQSRGATLITR